jgi:hypothetical protein
MDKEENMNLMDVVNHLPTPIPWSEGEKIPSLEGRDNPEMRQLLAITARK